MVALTRCHGVGGSGNSCVNVLIIRRLVGTVSFRCCVSIRGLRAGRHDLYSPSVAKIVGILYSLPTHRKTTVKKPGIGYKAGWGKSSGRSEYDRLYCNKESERRKERVFIQHLYTAFSLKALRHGSHSFTCKLHHACL